MVQRKSLNRPPSQRQLRVCEEIRHVVARVLLQEELYDETLSGIHLMVTEVKISPDFSVATCYVHPIGNEENGAKIIDILNGHKGYFRKFLGHELKLRITPDVRFKLDETFEAAAKIDALFSIPKVKADLV